MITTVANADHERRWTDLIRRLADASSLADATTAQLLELLGEAHLALTQATSRLQTEQPYRSGELETEIQLLRSAVEASNEAIISTTPDGIITSWNSAATRLTGYASSEVIGQSAAILLPLNRAQELSILLEKLEAGELIKDFETVRQRKDGMPIYVLLSLTSIVNSAGVRLGYTSLVHDITERKVVETKNAALAAIVESSDDAIMSLTLDGVITSWNKSAETLFGYTLDEMIGQSVARLMPVDRPAEFMLLLAKIKEGQSVNHHETLRLRKDGTSIDVSLTLSPVFDTDGQIIGASKIYRDITLRKAASDRLRFQARLLDAVDQAVIAVDLQGKITYWNRFATALYGWQPDQVLGQPLANFRISTNDLKANEVGLQLRAGHSWRGEFVARRRDGSTFPAIVRDTPIYDDNGALIGTIGVSTDITERKQSEAALQASEARYRMIVETASEGIWLINNNAETTYVNKRMAEMLGYPVEDIIGARPGIFVSAENRPKLGMYRERRQQGIAERFEFEFQRKDTSPLHTLVSSTPLRDEQGQPGGSLAMVTDITERKRAEADVVHALVNEQHVRAQAELLQERLAFLLEASTLLSTSFDYTVRLHRLAKLAVPQLADWCAIDVLTDGVLKRVATAHVDPDKVALLYTLLDRFPANPNASAGIYHVVKTGEAELYADIQEAPIRASKDGGERLALFREIGMVSSMVVPLMVQDHILGVITLTLGEGERRYGPNDLALATDLARRAALLLENAQLYEQLRLHAIDLERRVDRRTTELRHSKERVEAVLNSTTDGIIVVRRDGTISQVNPTLVIMFGYQPVELIGRAWRELFVPSEASRLKAIVSSIGPGSQATRVELTTQRKDGTMFSVELGLSPVGGYGENADPAEFVCTITDVTDRKRAELALQQALQQEKELGELKMRFVSMASHEFRTPLATISATTDTLSAYWHKMTETQIEQKFAKIKDQVGHLKDIMEDVLFLARMQARRVEFNPVMLDLDTLCQSVIEEFESRPDIHHQFIYSCSGVVQDTRLDKKLMRQIIGNLISNAVKYSPPDKPVRIGLEFASESVVLSISDEGIGVTESDQKHLFEPFHRGNNVGSVSGTGLGLVITKESIEMHGGTIIVASQIKAGTTFTVRIPLAI